MKNIRGVNLGGWFVLERWMKPDLFEGVSGPDETVFCVEAEDAKAKLRHHWETFITEADFSWIKERGINSVRIPIPWWAFVEHEVYFSALPYIKQALKWAHQYDLNVLLDLHTAPGCQNGFDNGGITGVIDWPTEENINQTLDILEIIAETFKDEPALWGIEVLNEPHWTIDLSLIQSFYQAAYNRIRKHHNEVVIVFHDAFRASDPSWLDFFQVNDFQQVAFDLHLYHCFEDRFQTFTIDDHVKEVWQRKEEVILKLQPIVPIIVGEWSLGLPPIPHKDSFNKTLHLRMLATAQLEAYEQGWGFYFWSYKIERDSHFEWDFRRLVEAGILPDKYE